MAVSMVPWVWMAIGEGSNSPVAELLLLLVHDWSCPQPGGTPVPTTLGFKGQI